MPDQKFIAKFLKGSAFTSLGTLVSVALHFLSIKLLAEYMPQQAFGVYSLIIIVSHGVQILGGLGLNLSLVKNLSSGNEDDKKEVVSVIFIARFLQIGLLSLLIWGLGHLFLPVFFDDSIDVFIKFIPPIVFLASFRELLFHLLQGIQLFNRYAVVNIISACIRLVSIAFFSFWGELSVYNMILVELITYGASFGLLIILSPILNLLTFKISLKAIKRVFAFSTPLYANDILTYIHNKISVLLIGGLLTPTSVAKYEMATKLPEGFGRLFSSLIVVYFPSISELLSAEKKEEASFFMNRGVIVACTVLSMVTLFTFLFKEEIILIVFSDQYLDASLALSLLMLNFTINAVGRVMGYTVVAAGHSSVPVRINMVSTIINTLGCLLLIPRFGFMGAIYSLLIMSTISQLLNYHFLVRADVKPDIWGFAKSILILGLVVALYLLVGLDVFVARGIALLVFGLLCWIFIPEIREASAYATRYLRRIVWKPT